MKQFGTGLGEDKNPSRSHVDRCGGGGGREGWRLSEEREEKKREAVAVRMKMTSRRCPSGSSLTSDTTIDSVVSWPIDRKCSCHRHSTFLSLLPLILSTGTLRKSNPFGVNTGKLSATMPTMGGCSCLFLADAVVQ